MEVKTRNEKPDGYYALLGATYIALGILCILIYLRDVIQLNKPGVRVFSVYHGRYLPEEEEEHGALQPKRTDDKRSEQFDDKPAS